MKHSVYIFIFFELITIIIIEQNLCIILIYIYIRLVFFNEPP